MWSSVNSSERLSGLSSARDSSDTVTPPSMGFGDVHDRDASFLIVDATHPTLDCRTSRAIAGGWRERYRFSGVARHKLLDHSIRRLERACAHGAPAELEPKLKLPAVRSERSARERVRRTLELHVLDACP